MKRGGGISETEYKDGLRHGKYVEYNEKRVKVLEGDFRYGEKVGEWIEYDDHGNELKRKIH